MFPARFRGFLIIAIVAGVGNTGISNRSEDQGQDNPAGIKCNVTKNGVNYSVERNPETNKTILKVEINDHYTVVVPSAGPTPIRYPNSTGPPPAESEEVTTENILLGEAIRDIYEDSWSYEEDSVNTVINRILGIEKQRHEVQTEGEIVGHETLKTELRPDDWKKFCTEAAKEDNEILLVSDGSFHPKFEVVPGVGVYRFHATPLEWKSAREVCEKEGAQLAVANSEEEEETLRGIHNRCRHILDTHFNAYQYLGVHDRYSEGKWETTGGIPLEETGFVRWARGQPDNSHHFGENCISLNRDGFLNDVPCWTKLPFTCEHA